MNPLALLSSAKLFGSLALAAALAFLVIDWRAKSADVAAEKACEKAISAPSGDLSGCPPVIGNAATAARSAKLCDAALLQTPAQGGFAIETSCGAGTKERVAQLAAAQAARDAALAAEHQADSDRDAEIARAEGRAHQMDQEVISNARTISAAPRNPDGSVHCDADCLRSLSN